MLEICLRLGFIDHRHIAEDSQQENDDEGWRALPRGGRGGNWGSQTASAAGGPSRRDDALRVLCKRDW